jgi:hypothetical protein
VALSLFFFLKASRLAVATANCTAQDHASTRSGLTDARKSLMHRRRQYRQAHSPTLPPTNNIMHTPQKPRRWSKKTKFIVAAGLSTLIIVVSGIAVGLAVSREQSRQPSSGGHATPSNAFTSWTRIVGLLSYICDVLSLDFKLHLAASRPYRRNTQKHSFLLNLPFRAKRVNNAIF